MSTPDNKKLMTILIVLIILAVVIVGAYIYTRSMMSTLTPPEHIKTAEELRANVIAQISATSSTPISTSTRAQILKKLAP